MHHNRYFWFSYCFLHSGTTHSPGDAAITLAELPKPAGVLMKAHTLWLTCHLHATPQIESRSHSLAWLRSHIREYVACFLHTNMRQGDTTWNDPPWETLHWQETGMGRSEADAPPSSVPSVNYFEMGLQPCLRNLPCLWGSSWNFHLCVLHFHFFIAFTALGLHFPNKATLESWPQALGSRGPDLDGKLLICCLHPIPSASSQNQSVLLKLVCATA